MAELSIHRVTSVVAHVGEPQDDLAGEKYAVTKIIIHTKDEEHQVVLFGARNFDNPQTPVYPFVELERPNVEQPND
jgi:hypothetical protein